MARRWICPECNSGINAPERMGKLDPRRFCLSCSGKPGVKQLVSRTCPTLAKRRERKKVSRKEKAQKTKAKQAAIPLLRSDVKLQRLFKRLTRLKAWGGRCRDARLTKIRRSKTKSYSTGRAWWLNRKIVVTLGTQTDSAGAGVLFLHELAHLAAPISEHHGDQWRALFVESAVEFYGINLADVDGTIRDLHNVIAKLVREKQSETPS